MFCEKRKRTFYLIKKKSPFGLFFNLPVNLHIERQAPLPMPSIRYPLRNVCRFQCVGWRFYRYRCPFYRPKTVETIKITVSFCFFFFDYCLLFLHSATLAQSFRYNPLKLSIRRTEFICRPFLDSFHSFCVHSEHKAFYHLFLCHFLH